jgi:2-keto-4-pentenoate hydratase/2-oxohepta-3-ene-1,7-dioic acid hydratase in catechol pathway
MKLLRVGDAGREIPAALDATGRLRDLSRSVRDIDPGILGEDVLDRLRGLDLTALPEIAGSLRNGPCVAGIRKIVCVGLNYRDHALEAALPIPAEPVLFLRLPVRSSARTMRSRFRAAPKRSTGRLSSASSSARAASIARSHVRSSTSRATAS